MAHKNLSERAFEFILKIDNYISERSPEVRINDNPRLAICETGWYTFSANAKWLLLNYLNTDTVPYNQIAFTARYLLEISSDYNYILSKESNSRLNAFLKQYKTAITLGIKDEKYFENVTKESFMNDARINCARDEKSEKILKRVGMYFGEFGVGHYNLESSCCHCNFCGMLVAANSNSDVGLPLRRDTIQVIPTATEKMIDALNYVDNYKNAKSDLKSELEGLDAIFRKEIK